MFALLPLFYKAPDAVKIFNIPFVIVIASILVQGTTVGFAARWTRMKKVDA